jgi:hypothetical protein
VHVEVVGYLQRLNLRLLVHAQHDGALRRVEIEADDVADLVNEQRVFGKLPRPLAMGLQPERPPDPRDRGLVESDLGSHRPRRPMRRALRSALERLGDHLFDLGVGDLSRLPRPRLVQQPVEPKLNKPPAPQRHRVAMNAQPSSNLGVALASRARQHDPRPQRQRRPRRAPTRPRFQRLALLTAQLDRHSSRTRHHQILLLHNN